MISDDLNRYAGRLAGLRTVVTGSGRGIGHSIAKLFSAESATIACVDRDFAAATAAAEALTADGGAGRPFAADVANSKDARRAVTEAAEWMGGIDILVNNVGIGGHGTVETTTEEDWDHVMGTNPKSIFLMAKNAIPHMRSAGGGAIVNIGSGLGVTGASNWAAYSASKASVVMLTKLMALDHAGEGIRVNCVCPGMVETELSRANLRQAAADSGESFEAKRQQAIKSYPLGRLGQPEDIAQAVLFLASSQASYITGAVLVVDGGRCAGTS